MILFNAFSFEHPGAEAAFEIAALMYICPVFIVCLKSVEYFSADGAWHLL